MTIIHIPAIVAATVLADASGDTITVSIWIAAEDLELCADDRTKPLPFVLAHDDATTSLLIPLEAGVLLMDLPSAITASVVASKCQRLVLAVSPGPTPADWWSRPTSRSCLIAAGSTADFRNSVTDASILSMSPGA